MPLPAWAVQKLGPLPLWGWGAAAGAGGIGWVLYKRRSSGSSSPTLANVAQAVKSTYPDASGDAGSFGGSPGSGQPGTGGIIGVSPGAGAGSGSTTGPGSGFTSGTGSGSTSGGGLSTSLPASPYYGTPDNPIYRAQPAVTVAPSFLGGGYQAGQGVVLNPVGSADALAALSGGTYTPSLTDYASEQPGGLQTIQAGLPGTQPGQGTTYSIYNTNTGSGPVVPASQRKAGERYDMTGRVIL